MGFYRHGKKSQHQTIRLDDMFRYPIQETVVGQQN
jgi:hypothetical protein